MSRSSMVDCSTRWASALAALWLLAGCEVAPIEVISRSFDRPSHVAFVCFDSVTSAAVSLDSCEDGAEGFALHALVTQSHRGEVAAVDLDENRVLDSDVRVPGYTFVRVGEVPGAIVVAAREPSFAYVANLGSRDVRAVPTAQFRPDAPAPASPRKAAASAQRLRAWSIA